MEQQRDYYEVLGVSREASEDEIKRASRISGIFLVTSSVSAALTQDPMVPLPVRICAYRSRFPSSRPRTAIP